MTIAYPDILSLKAPPARFEWSEDRAILYALGIGMCADGLDPRELPFVVDPGTVALPTLATVVAWGPNLTVEIAAGLTFEQIVHAYQKVELHRPMPASGSVEARFAAPVYPGETLTFDMWRDQDVISFEAKVAARGSTVLRGGRTTLRERP